MTKQEFEKLRSVCSGRRQTSSLITKLDGRVISVGEIEPLVWNEDAGRALFHYYPDEPLNVRLGECALVVTIFQHRLPVHEIHPCTNPEALHVRV